MAKKTIFNGNKIYGKVSYAHEKKTGQKSTMNKLYAILLVALATTVFVGAESVPRPAASTARLHVFGAQRRAAPAHARARVSSVTLENAKTERDGVSASWFIKDEQFASQREIEGYASATSVNRGETIQLYVSVKNATVDATHTIVVYRIGWYGGVGGRKILGPFTRASHTQPKCPMVKNRTRTIECSWTYPMDLTIPLSSDPTVAPSGVYLARLETPRGKASYVIFVVRDDDRRGDILFQTSDTTYAAYNTWGGYSFYTGHAPTYAASFNRPYANTLSSSQHGPINLKGAGEFLAWELHAVRFLERNGYDVVYSSSIDTARSPARLRQFRVFLSVGHDEYWPRETYDAVEGARNAGINLMFLGSNTAYWGARLEADAQGVPNRRVVSYKMMSYLDPLRNTPHATGMWRLKLMRRPEAALTGISYDSMSRDLDMVVHNCSCWICAGTDLRPGDRLKGLLGYEVDRATSDSPANLQVIMRSPYNPLSIPDKVNETRYAHLSYYTHANGAGVFASGSMQWTWGLDAWAPHPNRANENAQTITRNVLDRFVGLRSIEYAECSVLVRQWQTTDEGEPALDNGRAPMYVPGVRDPALVVEDEVATIESELKEAGNFPA